MKQNVIIKEFCAENFTDVPNAIANGAKRIELCDNLAKGGTTPCYSVIKKTVEFSQKYQVPVMIMIRPRAGNFEYQKFEIEMMLEDIAICRKLGVKGVVFGCIKDGWIDEEATDLLIDASKGLEITYHMAFDCLPKAKQYPAIDWLAQRGVNRILTHGGAANRPIEQNISHLQKLIAYADQRVGILPGAGIHYKNVESIVTTLNSNEAHGTRIVRT